jgi:hypothetical protein
MKKHIRKLLSFWFLAFIHIGLSAQSLTITNGSGVAGSGITVAVNAEGIADLASFQWTIVYDETKLTYVNCSDWDADFLGVTVNSDTDGKLTFAYAEATGSDITAEQLLFNINFDIIPGASGTADVVWSDDPTPRELGNSVPEIISASWYSGSVTIHTPTITIDDVTGVAGFSVVVPVNATYFEDIQSFQWTVVFDNTLLTYTGCTNWATGITSGDVLITDHGDGTLSFIYNSTAFDISDGRFFELNFDIDPSALGVTPLTWSDNPTIREIGNSVPTEILPTWNNGSIDVLAANPAVSIASVDGVPGASVSVPVAGFALKDLQSFQWTIDYDETKLSYVNCTNWFSEVNEADLYINDNGSVITVAYNGSTGFDLADNLFFNLNFNVDANALGTAALTWSDSPTTRELANSAPEVITASWNSGSVIIDLRWDGSESSDWQTAANWTQGQVPASTNDVVIPDGCPNYPVIDDGATTAECNDMRIEANSNVRIAVNGQMTVNGSLVNNNGTAGIIVQSDATGTGSLIMNSTGVQGTFQQYLSHTNGQPGQWHFIGSPVTAASAEMFTGNNFYTYEESVDDWWTGTDYFNAGSSGWQAPAGDLEPGKGYIQYYTAATMSYEGEFNYNSAGLTQNIPYTEHTGNAANGNPYSEFDGWNLVSNPYQSSVDWLQIEKSADMNMSMYYYDGETDNYKYYLDNDDGTGTGLNGATQYIPAGQGFFVKAGNLQSATMVIPNAARVHNNLSVVKSTTQNTMRDKLVFNISHLGRTDECAILFKEGALSEFNAKQDVYKRFSWDENMPQLFSLSGTDSVHTAIKTYGTENNLSVPVAVKVPKTSEYRIDFTELRFPFDYAVFEDSNKDSLMNPAVITDYTFKTDGGMILDRFTLHFYINSPPIIKNTVSDVKQTAEVFFAWQADDFFSDSDIFDHLSYEIKTADGKAFPKWMKYDVQTGTISGTPQNSDTGRYRFIIKALDLYGGITQDSFTLEVNYKNHPPVVNNPTEELMMPTGRDYTVELPADMFWDDPNMPLNISIQIPESLSTELFFDTQNFTLSGELTDEALGTHRLTARAEDSYGEIASFDFDLNVLQGLEVIKYPQDPEVCAGDDAKLEIDAKGTELSYQWFFMGEIIEGAHSPSLIVSNINSSHEGLYECLVSDIFDDEYTGQAEIILSEQVQITQEPEPYVSADSGGKAIFLVEASGTDLNWQWRKDGVNLSENSRITGVHTHQLMIDSVNTSDEGFYSVKISGKCGERISQRSELKLTVSSNALNNEGIKIFPNPATDILYIMTGETVQSCTYKVYDYVGRHTYGSPEYISGTHKLDVSNYAPGLYYIKFKTKDKTEVLKFIKQ